MAKKINLESALKAESVEKEIAERYYFAVGAFAPFVVASLREINSKIDSIPKHHWGMGVYMDNIPQNEQNIARLVSVPLKIYEKSEYSDIPVPRKGEEFFGVREIFQVVTGETLCLITLNLF